MGKCEHGLTSKECYTCASPKHGKHEAREGMSEALKLADTLERMSLSTQWDKRAAAELRRLHATNQELLEALKEMLAAWEEDPAYGYDSAYKARAAIAKAEQ